MPYSPDAPPSGSIKGPDVSKDLDTFHITHLEIVVNPNDASQTRVRVLWSKGYMETGTYKPVEQIQTVLQGQDLIDKINSATSGGTVYNEVKTAVWELLVDGGHVPAGAIT